jgi:hypothetical protein
MASSMPGSRQQHIVLSLLFAIALATSCGERQLGSSGAPKPLEHAALLVEARPSALDVLFVVEREVNEQILNAMVHGFPTLLEALRRPDLGGALPDLRIGVISSDLGVGGYATSWSWCSANGDGAKLQNTPRTSGCTPPADRWIAHREGVHNITGCTKETAACLAEAFGCIAHLSTGCNFEMPLEAMRRALDPARNLNPGFLRPEASLLVIFIAEEDDCSVRREELLDPSKQAWMTFGPSSWRCFQQGIRCDINDRSPGRAKTASQPMTGFIPCRSTSIFWLA